MANANNSFLIYPSVVGGLYKYPTKLSEEVSMKGSKGGFGKGKGSSKKGFVAGPAIMTGKKGLK